MRELLDYERQPKKQKLVVGIDPGTTRFVVTIGKYPAKGKRPDIRPVTKWTGCYEEHSISGQLYSFYPPSALLYKLSGGLPETGHSMTVALETTNVLLDLYFPFWKLMFHAHMNDPTLIRFQKETQRKLEKLGKTTDDLPRDFVAYLYNRLLTESSDSPEFIRSTWGVPISNYDIDIVVAVPPGRSVIDHDVIFQSFVQGPIQSHQVFLVSEPEALLCSWTTREIDSHDWEV